MLKTNRTIVIETLKQLVVEQEDSSSSAEIKSSEEECEVVACGDGKTSEEYIQLEKDINRMLQNPKIKSGDHSSSGSESSESVASLLSSQRIPPLRKICSRTSSFDSSCNPASPFQNNPLLVSHDYAKSPLMEIAEDSNSSVKDDGGGGSNSSRKESTSSSSGGTSDQKEDPPPTSAATPIEIAAKQQQSTNQNPSESEASGNSSAAQSVADFDPKTSELSEPHRFAPKDLLSLLRSIESEIHSCETVVKDENDKRKRHKIDDCRRVHNYEEFITTFLTMLTEQGMLGDLLEYGLNPKKKPATGSSSDSRGNGAKKSNSSTSSSSSANRVSSSSSRRSSKSRPGRPKKRK